MAGTDGSARIDVILTDPGNRKIQTIKAVRAATGLGLKEAKALVDAHPKAIKEGLEPEEAELLRAELEGAGAQVELTVGQVAGLVTAIEPETAPASSDVLDQIRKLAELRDAGIVTPDEFESKKAELLARL